MTNLRYTGNRCDLNLFTKYLPRVYSLGDERQVGMDQRHFWCLACNQFSVCESLELDPDDVEFVKEQLREMREWRDTPPETAALLPEHKLFECQQAATWIAEIESAGRDWAEWRSRRTAPAKCLQCGASVADVPTGRWSSFAHGRCGGTIDCGIRIGSSTGFATFPHVYDIDGNLMEKGRKPVKSVYAPHYQAEYGPLELFFQPLDHDPFEEFERSPNESAE